MAMTEIAVSPRMWMHLLYFGPLAFDPPRVHLIPHLNFHSIDVVAMVHVAVAAVDDMVHHHRKFDPFVHTFDVPLPT